VVGGFYWFYSPLFWMANHPWEILETPREAASSLEGHLAAGLWSFGECSSESRGEQGSWGLVGWYGFTMIYPQFLWQLYALLMGKLTTCREFEVTLGLWWDFGVPHFPNNASDVEAICSKFFQFFFINVIHNKKSIIPNSKPFVYLYIIFTSSYHLNNEPPYFRGWFIADPRFKKVLRRWPWAMWVHFFTSSEILCVVDFSEI
jgi:hypothetical protein